MLRKRIIVCLDIRDGEVVKGVRFVDLRHIGSPSELAARYQQEGADEVVFLDISASHEGRKTMLDVVRQTAEQLFVPLTVGGGISTLDDIARALRAGADKVSINTAAVATPELLTEAASRFGSQCVVASIDAKLECDQGGREAVASGYRVYTHGGRTPTELDAVAWARECAALGTGEILLTAIDNDGGRDGYDLRLTRGVVEAVAVPVIASGGAGCAQHIREALTEGRADAVPIGMDTALVRQADATIPGGIRFVAVGSEESRLLSTLPGSLVQSIDPESGSVGVLAPTRVGRFDSYLNSGMHLSDDDAYLIAKTIHGQWESLRRDYPLLSSVSPEMLAPAATPHPYHPGAARYYREAGLWTDAHERNQAQVLAAGDR